MTDATDFNESIQKSMNALQKLWALYHDERDGSQWTRRDDMPAVSSSGKSDPTGQVAVVERREARAEDIAGDAAWLASKLEEIIARHEPKQTGPCQTEGCIREGISRWDGRCEKCGPWIEHHRYRGLDDDPADQDGLVEQWNSQAYRDCGCEDPTCCPNGCLQRIEPDGSTPRVRNPICDKCRNEQSRQRKRLQAETEDRQAS